MNKVFSILFCSVLFFCEVFSQDIPQTINYQGVLKDASGNVVSNGDYNLTFRLYNSETGGSPLWTETKSVSISDGIFFTKLGDVDSLNLPFDAAYWLGISVGSEPEMTPRIELSTVPYSFMSLNVPDGSITAQKIASNQIIKSINGLKDSINLVAGSNITITPSGNDLTISAASGAGGTLTQVNTGAGLTGGPITTTGTISIANDGITSVMLQNNSVTADKITDGTISTADLSDNSVTSAKISDGTITTTDLANNSVTTDKITDGTITATDIANTQVVKSINSLKDNVNLVAGSNVTITPSGQNLTISSTSGGVGGSGTTNYIPLFTGSTTLGNSSIYESSGKIGIGLTTPTHPLDVYGTGQVGIQFNGDNPYYSSIYVNALSTNSIPGFGYLKNGVLKGTTDVDNDGKFRIRTGTSLDTRLVIDANGNVGIGTNTPAYPIHISSNSIYTGYFISNSSIGTPHVIHSEFKGTGNVNSVAIYGYSKPAQAYGYGGYFEGGNIGALAKGSNYGLRGENDNGNYGYIASPDYGVYGVNADSNNYGYIGGKFVGVYGFNHSGTAGYLGGYTSGAYGYSTSGNGVYGVTGNGFAVLGFCNTGGTAIYGAVNDGGNYAGYFYGNVNITGTLTKGSGAFKIDHPLDPQNKYLYHSFVESPDMMNIYNGNVITDASGYATVTLPDWFEALNKDFRYQLTVIGDFAQAIIAQEIQNNQFTIRTDKPNVKVSWQITGIRHDPFAEKNRIPVEEYKQGDDVGKYLYPDAYNVSETMGIDYKHRVIEKEREK